jgi:hypothetical protein
MVQAHNGGLSVFVAAALVACAPERQAPSDSAQPDTVTATKALGTLEVRLSVPARVGQRSPVPITVDLVNRGDTAVALVSPGDTEYPPFDVIVVSASGDTVWREPPPDAARQASLQLNPPIAPGERQAYGRARWEQVDMGGRRVSPGTYGVSVMLFAPAPWGDVVVGPANMTIGR